jgi:Amt family ammonium transporter
MAMVGGVIIATLIGKQDPGFVHNGALAGLVAICAGSDIVHPIGALIIGGVGGLIFTYCFTLTQERLKIDDVLGVWPLHGLCGVWGGIAVGIFGMTDLGGLGGVSLISQTIGSLAGVIYALAAGMLIYLCTSRLLGIRLSDEEQYIGADRAIHSIGANPEGEI